MAGPLATTDARLRRQFDARAVRRPLNGRPGEFDLTYTRTRRSADQTDAAGTPIVVIPGGPGMSSMLPYARLRAHAAKQGLDLIMIDHRGVGLSRTDTTGADLTHDDMWLRLVVEDVLAVLDAEGVDEAILYGASYGTYVAQAVGAAHPDRVAGLILDSAMLGAQDHHDVRDASRATLWDGAVPATRRIAAKLRTLVESGAVPRPEAEAVARIVYEFAGPDLLEQLLDDVHAGRNRLAWRQVAKLNDADVTAVRRHLMEFDLVGAIAFRELNAAPEPDGLPFDPGTAFARDGARFPAFSGEPYDLAAAAARAPYPILVLSGERDLRTPPATGRRIAALAPRGRFVSVRGAGHSLLDTRPRVALAVLAAVVLDGGADARVDEVTLGDLTARTETLSLATVLRALVRAARVLPGRRVRG